MQEKESNPMDCRRFEEQLEPLLTGTVSADEGARVEAHAAACERCARLLAIVRGEHEVDGPADADTFVATLMQKTVGSACARAEANLCAWVDGELETPEADLVALHVEHCATCTAVAVALRAVTRDLAGMANIDPGPAFTQAVLARTRATAPVAAAVDAPQSARAWAQRLREEWQALLMRPRAAWELATAGCFVLLLLCGLPFSPMRSVPQQALSVAQINPVAAARSAVQQVRPLWNEHAATLWEHSGGFVIEQGRAAVDGLAASRPQTVEAWQDLGMHTAETGRAMWKRDRQQFAQSVRALGDDVEALWAGLWSVAADTLETAPQPPEE